MCSSDLYHLHWRCLEVKLTIVDGFDPTVEFKAEVPINCGIVLVNLWQRHVLPPLVAFRRELVLHVSVHAVNDFASHVTHSIPSLASWGLEEILYVDVVTL